MGFWGSPPLYSEEQRARESPRPWSILGGEGRSRARLLGPARRILRTAGRGSPPTPHPPLPTSGSPPLLETLQARISKIINTRVCRRQSQGSRSLPELPPPGIFLLPPLFSPLGGGKSSEAGMRLFSPFLFPGSCAERHPRYPFPAGGIPGALQLRFPHGFSIREAPKCGGSGEATEGGSC